MRASSERYDFRADDEVKSWGAFVENELPRDGDDDGDDTVLERSTSWDIAAAHDEHNMGIGYLWEINRRVTVKCFVGFDSI